MTNLIKIFGVIVPTFFTANGSGVSISEVNRRQAEAKQQNDEFWGKLQDAVAGFFQKVLSFVGAGNSLPQALNVVTITTAEIAGYSGVAQRNAHTAVLMHGVKLYKRLQEQLQRKDLRLFVADELPEYPVRPEPPAAPQAPACPATGTACGTEDFMDLGNIDEMIANLKPEVLAKFDFTFFMRANELNAKAAAIGKLLSEQGSFFRQMVKPLPKGSEQLTQTGVVVTTYKRAYTDEQVTELTQYRDTLQAEYNDLQRRLNGLKKQVKDAVRAYNLDAERSYQAAYRAYQLQHTEYQAAVQRQAEEYQRAVREHAVAMEQVRSAAETLRQQALAEMATLRVRTE